MEALAKRKAALSRLKEEEASRPLPEGWRRVASNSRPGEFVYENIHTEERIAWFPTETAREEGIGRLTTWLSLRSASAALVAQNTEDSKKEALKQKNLAALEKRKAALQAQKYISWSFLCLNRSSESRRRTLTYQMDGSVSNHVRVQAKLFMRMKSPENDKPGSLMHQRLILPLLLMMPKRRSNG